MRQESDRVREIKRSFRGMMNGTISSSMRDKGVSYSINWGVPLPMLREEAEQIGKDYSLAIALWKENVRECKILAVMIMPAEKMSPEIADIWMNEMPTLEMAQIASLHLFQYLPYAADKAYQWIASAEELQQISGYSVLTRLFMRRQEPNTRGINEYLDQLQTAVQDDSLNVRKAALASAHRFAQLGLMYERMVTNTLRKVNLSLF